MLMLSLHCHCKCGLFLYLYYLILLLQRMPQHNKSSFRLFVRILYDFMVLTVRTILESRWPSTIFKFLLTSAGVAHITSYNLKLHILLMDKIVFSTQPKSLLHIIFMAHLNDM